MRRTPGLLGLLLLLSSAMACGEKRAPAPSTPAATREPASTERSSEIEGRASACVEDVLEDVASNRNRPSEEAIDRSELVVREMADVDGDGRPEQLVTSEYRWCGVTGNCVFALYLSGGGCSRYAGTLAFSVESEQVLEQARGGVRDLAIFRNDGCAGLAGTVETLGWDGERYVSVERVECGCPDEDPSAPRDPRCP